MSRRPFHSWSAFAWTESAMLSDDRFDSSSTTSAPRGLSDLIRGGFRALMDGAVARHLLGRDNLERHGDDVVVEYVAYWRDGGVTMAWCLR